MLHDHAEPVEAYRPGVCNIGPAEVERRRRSAIAATVMTGIVAVLILALGLPSGARLALLPFATATAITWLQVTRQFCVAFGAVGLRNFGALGGETAVADRAARTADRRMTLRMILEGLLYGALITLAFWLVANWLLPS